MRLSSLFSGRVPFATLSKENKTSVTNDFFYKYLPAICEKYNRPFREMEEWRLTHTRAGQRKMARSLTAISGLFIAFVFIHYLDLYLANQALGKTFSVEKTLKKYLQTTPSTSSASVAKILLGSRVFLISSFINC